MENEKELPAGWESDFLENMIQPRGEKALPSDYPHLKFVGMDHVESKTTKIIGCVAASEMKSSAARFYIGDVLYGRLRPYLNKVTKVNFNGLASAEFIVFPDSKVLNNSYLKHRLNAADFVRFAAHLNEGDRPRVSFEQIGKFAILLPPLAEQHRIVAKIEELFSELDKGLENLRAAQQQLKVYRQAVLQWAFEGKLTAEWRKADWQWSSLGDFAEDIKIGPFGTMLHESDYVLHGIPVINPKHIKNQRIHPDPRNAVAQAKADDLSAYKLRENDVLLGRRGEMGRTAYVTNKEAGWLCGTGSMIIRLRKNNLAKIYSMILSEKRVKDHLEHNSTGTTMNNLNEKIVKAVSVPVIPFPEQHQIVAEIESRLSVCDKLEETIEQSLLQAEALRQSILKKAFAGKLVPQDPSDEPAEKLLARIRADRAAAEPAKITSAKRKVK